MVLVRPVTKTKISTAEFGHPVYDILKNLAAPVWTNATPATGFEQFGGTYKNLAYLEIGRLVILQGMLKTLNDVTTTVVICATIPVAIAPPATVLTGCFAGLAGGYLGTVRADIEAGGNIKVRGTPTSTIAAGQYISFDSLWVRA